MESESSICNIANDINNEVKEILTKYLSPHLAQMNQDRMNMKCIENILRGMPEFQRLEKENIELRRQLEAKQPPVYEFVNTVKWTTCDKSNYCIKHAMTMPVPAEPVSAALEPAALVPEPAALAPDSIKLDIIETPIVEDNVTNELELYKAADLLHIVNNEAEASEAEDEQYEEAEEEEASEAEASEAEFETENEEEEEVEAEATEAEEEEEEEASEAEEEASEAEQEAEASEAEEEVASEAEEEASEAEEEASEAEEEEAEQEEEEEEEEQEEEAEEEVSLIVINGISYYTTNETSGDIYKVEGTDDVGDQVGKFVNKIATFF